MMLRSALHAPPRSLVGDAAPVAPVATSGTTTTEYVVSGVIVLMGLVVLYKTAQSILLMRAIKDGRAFNEGFDIGQYYASVDFEREKIRRSARVSPRRRLR